MANKTVGIAVDDHKLDHYKKTFTDKEFEIESVVKIKKKISVIKLICDESRIDEIKTICELLEASYKRRN